MKKENQNEVVENKVVIYPAMTSEVNGKQIYFLFSLYQIEDILGELKVFAVPFSTSFVEGITVWRNLTIPVISLEQYLGLPPVEPGKGKRFIVLRSAMEAQEKIKEMRIVIRAEREMKMIPIPDSSEFVHTNGWVNPELVKGVFEWNKSFIVVPETDQLFRGEGRF